MKRLPVPPLEQTLERYLETVEPLLDAAEFERTREAVARFASGVGPRCQRDLEEFAKAEHEAGRNWMSEAWLEAYLGGRDNLTLLSNVAFELAWNGGLTGVDLAADVVHRFVAVHLDYLRGDIEPDVGARGDELCMRQWRYLAGGVRDPKPGLDVFVPGPESPADREVIVLCANSGYAVRVSDHEGRVLPRAAIDRELRSVVLDAPHSDPPFTSPAYLDGEKAAEYFAAGLRDPANAGTYERLQNALFVVNLTSQAASLVTHMERTAFAAGQAWPFKPVTLQVSLADDRFVGLHIEHSTMDGATVQSIVGRAQAVTGDEAPLPASESETVPEPERLTWNHTDESTQRLTASIERYEQAAGGHRFRVVEVHTGPLPEVPFRVSVDALFQLTMLYAQLRTHGRVRSTYESVDMREYQAGRTECLRPNTPAAVAFATALVTGDATVDQLRAALDAHREQVKAAKSGQAIDRHLFGLKVMADRDGLEAPIFEDEGYARLVTDFLSTTSLGERTRIVRAAFAPTNPGCLGIYYCAVEDGFEFCLNYEEGVTERVDEYAEALQEGADRLMQVLREAADA